MCACMHCVCADMCIRVQLLVEAIASPPLTLPPATPKLELQVVESH